MKPQLFLFAALITAVSISATSCSDKSEDSDDPQGTITLNMLNESNGKTPLGNSDVYIDDANNFKSDYQCILADLGVRSGLGSTPSPLFSGVNDAVAVTPGHGYQVFKRGAFFKFPSGKEAFNVSADYYNVYVVSQTQKEGEIVGAQVKYVQVDAPDYGLPAYDTFIGTIDPLDADTWELTITLPTSDFEYYPDFASDSYYVLEHEKEGNKIILYLTAFNKSDVFAIYIRIRDAYTRVYGRVE